MKQFALLLMMTLAGGIAAPYHPFWGLLLYYTLAVLRPQYMWEWALPVEWRWSLFAALIVLVSVGLNFNKVVSRGRITVTTMLLIAYGVAILFSCLGAHHPVVAQSWAEEYAKVLLIAVIASVFIDELWHVRTLALMTMVMLGYIAWEINYMYVVEGGRLDVFHYGYGGLDNNGAGLMLAMGIPLAYAFAVAAPHRWQRAACWFVALSLVHAVMMTYSRGAMVAAVVGGIWLLSQHRQRMQAAVIVVFACIAISLLAGPEIRERFYSTERYHEDRSAQARFDSWAAAWAMAWEQPLTGQGVRNANIYSKNYGADRAGRTIHSVYLQIAADSGIPAMLIYIALMVVSVVALGRCKRMCRQFIASADGPRAPPDDAVDKAGQYEALALGLQGSIIIFAFGGIFLSLEVFELPWLLMVLGGVFPGVLQRHFAADSDEAPEPQAPTTRRVSAASPRSNITELDDLAAGLPLAARTKGWVHP